ncbi:hypothetical protein SAMD00019534_077050 [Acytostelium subglobosum LB1]|uniref:hypothetical protein n=1 Tax=Acytostelium subglobosum LB1 TaxID=1410327 RepID=UPI0006449B00|nr:hypothetical protein SAMD00019534_077050 [Acytostelium subglobosum LB1]GAM24530.1 hypothetical protein SAMD00019534_077050 [Acytostelium subglobosum LB1]|eukprot:XP_012752856.1 hypothetical protein SAMD00019534_077050 [Acytostelium subglobosum LB1]
MSRGRIALLILFDQLSRNMYRGSSDMFKFDPLALSLALSILDDANNDHTQHYSLPERVFIYLPLEHSERVEHVERCTLLMESIVDDSPYQQRKDLVKFGKASRSHLEIIQKFNRYPHRNILLNRPSTDEEKEYLSMAKSTFVKSVQVSSSSSSSSKSKADTSSTAQSTTTVNNSPKLKVLFLHGIKQSGTSLKKATKKLATSISDVATLYYANAPMIYQPSDDVDADNRNKANGWANVTDSAQSAKTHVRQWWNSSADYKTYNHIDKSHYYLEELFKTEGPFDGIIGFSQGAAFAGILAAMQQANQLPFTFKFAIMISGYMSRADIHQELMKVGLVSGVPALTILGTADDHVSPDRSRELSTLFTDSEVVEHQGGHFAPNKWPSLVIRSFLMKQQTSDDSSQSEGSSESSTQSLPAADIHQELDTFDKMMEVTYKENKARITANTSGLVVVDQKFALHLYGLAQSTRDHLANSPEFQSLINPQPTLLRDSVDESSFATLMSKLSPGTNAKALEDLIMIAWSTRLQFKQTETNQSSVFFRLWLQLYLAHPLTMLGNIDMFPKYGSWRDLCSLSLLVDQNIEMSLMDDNETLLEDLHYHIISKFAIQLTNDYTLMFGESSTTTTTTTTSNHSKKWPTTCALEAPRLNGTLALLAKGIARHISPMSTLREDASEVQRGIVKGFCYEKYRLIVSKLSNLLRGSSPKHVDQAVQMFKTGGATVLTDEERRKFLDGKPSGYVLNPEPEPVVQCTREELDPLLEFMMANTQLKDNTPMAFTRGTCMPDGRLDLCKQVVGPEGIKPLLGAMRQHSTIKRLLLGNNIVGNGGAQAIADYIEYNPDSKIDTWYIAGNNFDEEGITLIAEALHKDTKVKALWLKRNPLLPGGVRPLARMLEINTYLQTLDLLNCGILDEGVTTLFNSLKTSNNSTLKHLYIDANGLTPASAVTIRKHFENGQNKLESLYMSSNQFGDNGACEIALGLKHDTTLIRVGLGSNCIGPIGAKAVVDAVMSHPTLLSLNLGFNKSTFVLGALNNVLEDGGAQEVARLIVGNKTLRSIDLTHNGITQKGIRLLIDTLKQNNQTLTSLMLRQFAELRTTIKQEVDVVLNRNRMEWGKQASNGQGGEHSWMKRGDELAEDVDTPLHVQEILSVYRTK